MRIGVFIILCSVLFPWGGLNPVFAGEGKAGGARTRFVHTMPSVLELFRDYKGERSAAAFAELVNQFSSMGFAQAPASALTDGSEVLHLRFIGTPDRKDVSDVVLSGARMLAGERDPEATHAWIITVLPATGASSATLSVAQNEVLMVFPLIVAPRVDIDLDRNGSVTEADFALFLSDPGTARPPRFDMNRDGVRDYRDDYLFTVNYLVSLRREAANGALTMKSPASGADPVDDGDIPLKPGDDSPPDEDEHPVDDDMPPAAQ